jgi:hypothetical protein
MKTCIQCLETKELSCFSKNKAKIDGLHYICKMCDNLKQRNGIRKIKKSQKKNRKDRIANIQEIKANQKNIMYKTKKLC